MELFECLEKNAILYQAHHFNRRALFSISIQSIYFIHLSGILLGTAFCTLNTEITVVRKEKRLSFFYSAKPLATFQFLRPYF